MTTNKFSKEEIQELTAITLKHYDTSARGFWEGTKDHDVTQNYAAFLGAMPSRTGLKILDFGSGPGRDTLYFKNAGHLPTALDGSAAFCEMAATLSGCPVLHQNFVELNLPAEYFDGIFANASLFHVPSQELPRVLGELRAALVPQGVLFSSNPRGDAEGWSGDRFGNYMEWDVYEKILRQAGFTALHHYYRPSGLPCSQQPWLAVVARRD